jgi:hypothetical protein
VLRASEALRQLTLQLQGLPRTDLVQAFEQRMETDPAVARIRSEASRIRDLDDALRCDDGWTLVNGIARDVRTMVKTDTEMRLFQLVRMEGHVEGPLLHLLAALYEVDLWPQWMVPQTAFGGLRHTVTLETLKPTHFLCYLAARMPWPVKDRALVLEVKGVDCLDASKERAPQVVLLLNTTERFPNGHLVAGEGKGRVRTHLKTSGIVLTPEVGPGGIPRTLVQLVVCINPELQHLPTWVMNFFMRNLIFPFLPALRKQVPEVAKPSGPYGARISANPDLYGPLSRRLHECAIVGHGS